MATFDDSRFVFTTPVASVVDGELRAFTVAGVRMAVGKVGGVFYAFSDTCTHAECSLSEGDLEGSIVTCPCHLSQFDVTTGEAVRGPASAPLRLYATRVVSDALEIEP